MTVPSSIAPLDALATHHALEQSAAVRWWQVGAVLEVSGPDAATLLDGICTQAVTRIAPGTGQLGLFLDAKAKIIAPTFIHRLADAPWSNERRPDEPVVDAPRYALETLPGRVEPLREHIARYRLRARATLTASDLGVIAIAGPAAADAAAKHGGAEGSWVQLLGQGDATWVFVGSPVACADLVRGDLADQLADPDAWEARRIDAGVPGLHDLLVGRMPAEVGGMVGVALDAGCYLGQEPVVRLHFRGHPNRTLRRLSADSPLTVAPIGDDADAPFELRRLDADPGARPAGRLTTWARRPDGTTAALAVLRREVEAGDQLALPDVATPLRAVDAPPAATSA
jgi:folate-binding protein YgfZ